MQNGDKTFILNRLNRERDVLLSKVKQVEICISTINDLDFSDRQNAAAKVVAEKVDNAIKYTLANKLPESSLGLARPKRFRRRKLMPREEFMNLLTNAILESKTPLHSSDIVRYMRKHGNIPASYPKVHIQSRIMTEVRAHPERFHVELEPNNKSRVCLISLAATR